MGDESTLENSLSNIASDCLKEGNRTPVHPQKITAQRCQKNNVQFLGEKGISLSFQKIIEEIQLVAQTNATVLIKGETGTGKEIIARSIHENSSRKDGPFIAVNCGAIPNELMQSEFFGYLDGAFTGARRSGYRGKFQQAENGTIFLDEVSELTPAMQVSLLRVLQEKTVTPLGSTKEISLNFRILAATHRDLSQYVRQGRFREDLFYRLFVYPIYVPPLRERTEDIPYLAKHFCKLKQWDAHFSEAFFLKLQDYEWPGNVRELFNLLERLYIYSQGKQKDLSEVYQTKEIGIWLEESFKVHSISSWKGEAIPTPELNIRETIIRDSMIDALRKSKGNVTQAASSLGVPRSTFYKRIHKFGL